MCVLLFFIRDRFEGFSSRLLLLVLDHFSAAHAQAFFQRGRTLALARWRNNKQTARMVRVRANSRRDKEPRNGSCRVRCANRPVLPWCLRGDGRGLRTISVPNERANNKNTKPPKRQRRRKNATLVSTNCGLLCTPLASRRRRPELAPAQHASESRVIV